MEKRQPGNTLADRFEVVFVFATFFYEHFISSRPARSLKEGPPLPRGPSLPENSPRAEMEDNFLS